MANVLVEEDTLIGIADAIREKNGEEAQYKLSEMPDAIINIPSGSKEDFWDIYQEKGTRNCYQHAFSGKWWTTERFKPKYDIIPTDRATEILRDSNIPYNLDDILRENNITLDLSKSIDTFGCFMGSKFTKIGEVNVRSSYTAQQLFSGAVNLTDIRKLMIKNVKQIVSMMFYNCPKLTNVTIDGKVYGDMGLQNSPLLSDESIQSIIDALADLTDTKQQKITLHSSVVSKLSDAQVSSISNKNWTLA